MAIAVNPVNGKVYVANYATFPNNTISIIDPALNNSVTTIISESPYAWAIAMIQLAGVSMSLLLLESGAIVRAT